MVDSAVAVDSITALVTDELTGRPLTGATVQVSSAADGTPIGATVTTAANGVAVVPVTGATTVNISVFDHDYNYLTIANYPMTGSRLVAMPLRRNPVDNYGGYKGTFTGLPETPNVHAGIAAMSLPGSITDLSISQLLAPSNMRHNELGSVLKTDANVPAGVFLGLGTMMIAPDVSAQGLAGVCVDGAGNPDEAHIANGTCGTRSAWGLEGDIPLGDLPIAAFMTGGTIDFGQILGKITPLFKDFSSTVVRDVSFSLQPTPIVSGSYVFSDVSGFTNQDLSFGQTPLGFAFVVQVPTLPSYRGNFVDGVVVLGGADVPGRGVVPLGLGVALNTDPVDDTTDVQAPLTTAGLMAMRMSPTHAGTENAPYGLVALAVSLKGLSGGLVASALFPRIDDNQLVYDPAGTTKVDLGKAGAFPAFPDKARYNYSDTAQGALGARKFVFAANPMATDMQLVRVTFSDTLQHRWVVMLDPAQVTTGLILPKPPTGFTDRTFDNDDAATGGRSGLVVQTVRLSSDPNVKTSAPLSFSQLVEGTTSANRLNDFTIAFD